jgi:hypothetical protein
MSSHSPARPGRKFLSQTDDHRLNLYSLAAVAAGVSLVALAQPADAEVVVTRKTIGINVGAPAFVDLNKDGIADFEFSVTTFRTNKSSHLNVKLAAKALTGGEVVGEKKYPNLGPYASALVRGAKIGPSAHFSSSRGEITIQRLSAFSSGNGRTYGNWSYYSGKNHFLGVKFLIKGETHYGWIRLALGPVPQTVPTSVIGWAYETVANKKITAGETSDDSSQPAGSDQRKITGPSLGMLALGAGGLALWGSDQH